MTILLKPPVSGGAAGGGFNYLGNFSPAVNYVLNDIVNDGGNTYVATQAVPASILTPSQSVLNNPTFRGVPVVHCIVSGQTYSQPVDANSPIIPERNVRGVYFRIDVVVAGSIQFLGVTSSGDTFGYLLDSNGTTLATNDDNGGNGQPLITATLAVGTYYFAYTRFSGNDPFTASLKVTNQTGSIGTIEGAPPAWRLFVPKGETGGAVSGNVITLNDLFVTDSLTSYVADQGTSKTGLVVTGGFLTTTDTLDHSIHTATAALSQGKVLLSFDRVSASGTIVIYVMLKYVDDNNFLMMQFDTSDANGVIAYQRVAGTYTSFGNIVLAPSQVAVGDRIWMVGRLRPANRLRFEVWTSDPRVDEGGPIAAINSVLTGAAITALGTAVSGKVGLRLINSVVGNAKIKELSAISLAESTGAVDAF